MSMYLQADTNEPAQIASIAGWGDVCRWAARLSGDDFPLVRHLCRFGWVPDVADFTAQLKDAAENYPPGRVETRATLENLIAVLADTAEDIEVLSVTDGLGE